MNTIDDMQNAFEYNHDSSIVFFSYSVKTLSRNDSIYGLYSLKSWFRKRICKSSTTPNI